MKRDTPSWIFEGWLAAYHNEPWGDDWWQTGVIASAVANGIAKKAKCAADYMPFSKKGCEVVGLDAIEDALRGMC